MFLMPNRLDDESCTVGLSQSQMCIVRDYPTWTPAAIVAAGRPPQATTWPSKPSQQQVKLLRYALASGRIPIDQTLQIAAGIGKYESHHEHAERSVLVSGFRS